MRYIGITGYKGRLGRYLLRDHANFTALDCDVSNLDDVERCLRQTRVDAVLHLAAKSDVDWCEENEVRTKMVNVRGTFNVCHVAQVPVILLSSDHIFGGTWGMYREKDKGRPVNYYGWTKFTAESLRTVFDNLNVIRTSYLFDAERLQPQLADLRNDIPALYPTFIFRTFLYFPHFVEKLLYYIDHLETMPRILHLSGTENESWHGLVKYLGKRLGFDTRKLVLPKVQESISKTPRPYRGGLNTSLSRKLKFPQHSYKEGVDQMIKDMR